MERKTGRIAVISDTHGLLRPEVTEILKTCGAVVHGGDINSPGILEEIRRINPSLYVVRGNNDREWAEKLPKELSFSLFGRSFYMVHNKKHIPKDLEKKDFVIYGHSHKYESYVQEGVQYLNPGSCGPRRFNQPVTMAVLTIETEGFHIEFPEGYGKADKGNLKRAGKGNHRGFHGKKISGFKRVCGTGVQDLCDSSGSDRLRDHG